MLWCGGTHSGAGLGEPGGTHRGQVRYGVLWGLGGGSDWVSGEWGAVGLRQ